MIEHGASANSLNHIPGLQNEHPPHVCVVGAGISGLRCAEHLIRHGMKVTIIEARNRVGGRVGQYIYSKLQITPFITRQIHQSHKLGYPADM
jgi:monoamine oxidase